MMLAGIGEGDVLLLAQNGSQTADLSAQGGTNMLRAVRDQVFNATHYLVQESLALHQSTETGDLAGDCCPYLGFVVLEQLHKCGNEIPCNDLLIDCLGDLSQELAGCHSWLQPPHQYYLLEPVSYHVANPPALVLYQRPQRCEKHTVTGLLLLRHDFGN